MPETILALHGTQSNSSYFDRLADLGRESGLSFLGVNGPLNLYGGYQWYRNLGDLPSSIQYLQRIVASFKAPSEELVLLGHSQGGAIALEYGVRYPVKGVIAIGGRIEDVPTFQRYVRYRPPILMIHGEEDNTLSHAVSEQQAQQLQREGFPVTFVSCKAGHDIPEEELLPIIANWVGNLR